MRLLPSDQRGAVLNAACDFVKFHTHFRVDDPSGSGRCDRNIRIISGEEEGLFGWIAVNYLMDQFTKDDGRTTYGFLDMGGASTQIAFEPSAEQRAKTKDLIDVHLRLIGGDNIHHRVFVTTWLGYGTNQARERYVEKLISRYEASVGDDDEKNGPIPDPCLPRDLELHEATALSNHGNSQSNGARALLGTGSYEQCLKEVTPLLNKDAPCPDVPCLFNGVHVPHIDFSASHFIGVSEYWYSSEHVFGLGGAYNLVEFENAASAFCQRDWRSILRQHELSRSNGTLGGDGEVLEDGKVIDVGKWGDEVEISRLEMQCFKSAWLVNVLHDGIGMPRIVDPHGDSDDDSQVVKDKAQQKGLGKPMMQSLDAIGDTAISWTLGKMVLEASREITPLAGDSPTLPEPFADSDAQTPKAPIDQNADAVKRPFPVQMPDVYNLDLVSFNFLFYISCFIVLVIITFRLRRPFGKSLRRYLKSFIKGVTDDDRISLEEGRRWNDWRFSVRGAWTAIFSVIQPHAHRRWQPVRTLPSRSTSFLHLRPTASSSLTSSPTRHMQPPSSRASPTQSFSSPMLRAQSSTSVGGQNNTSYLDPSVPSRPSSSPPYRRDSNGHMSQPLYSLPRSRNNSQMNLTSLVTRQPLSRGGSGQHTPVTSYHEGD